MYLSEGVENSDFGFVRILISYKSANRPLLSHLYKVRSVMLLVFCHLIILVKRTNWLNCHVRPLVFQVKIKQTVP